MELTVTTENRDDNSRITLTGVNTIGEPQAFCIMADNGHYTLYRCTDNFDPSYEAPLDILAAIICNTALTAQLKNFFQINEKK